MPAARKSYKLTIGGGLVQVAIIAYLFFAIDTECRYLKVTPWDLFWSYVSGKKFTTDGGIVNLFWFVLIPITMNSLISITRYTSTGKSGYEIVFFMWTFWIYNVLFIIDTLFYGLVFGFSNLENNNLPIIRSLNRMTPIALLILAFPVLITLLVFIVRRIRRREFEFSFLLISTTLIPLVYIGYVIEFLMDPTWP